MAELVIFYKMPGYCFNPGERVPSEIKRIVREEIEAAAAHLSGRGVKERDEAIHEARKSIKKIRAVLRLVRPELGDIYALENTVFRDIGRQLSQFRDAGVAIETFDAARKKYLKHIDGRILSGMRRRLTARKARAEKSGNLDEVLSAMATAFDGPEGRVSGWPLRNDGFAAIAPGFEATLRRGRKAMARAVTERRPEDYHEWRKRAKEHWYHIRLLGSVWNDELEAYEKKLKDLEEALGEDHNLVILKEMVCAEPTMFGIEREVERFADGIEKYHKDLVEKAGKLGEEIYDEKPGRFTRKIGRLWDGWQVVIASTGEDDGRPKAAVTV